MLRGGERMETGGGIWMCGYASDEMWYEGVIELPFPADYVVEDFLEPRVPRIHARDTSEAGRRLPKLFIQSVAECGGVWRPMLCLYILGKPRELALVSTDVCSNRCLAIDNSVDFVGLASRDKAQHGSAWGMPPYGR